MDHDRALEKIKKCLEMAKGKNANANEAEIALRQAHKMMEAYNVEMGDVLASMASESTVLAGFYISYEIGENAVRKSHGCNKW